MNYDDAAKYPLTWPDRWPRTAPVNRGPSRFGSHTVNAAFVALCTELRRLGSEKFLMSSNIPRTKHGSPSSTWKQPADPGVAVYFVFGKKDVALACDKWLQVEDNIWALAKHIEALRGQERWGVGTLEQAFRGYMALPGIGQTTGLNWWQVLGLPINATAEQAKEAYRILAKKHHPDVNGDREFWDRIQEAYSQFERMTKK